MSTNKLKHYQLYTTPL